MNKQVQKGISLFLILLLITPVNVAAAEDSSFLDPVFSFFKSFVRTERGEQGIESEATNTEEIKTKTIDWSERFLETLPKDDTALILEKRSMYANYYYDTLTESAVAELHALPINYEKDGQFYPINTQIQNDDCLFTYCVNEGLYHADFALEPKVALSSGDTTIQYTLYAASDLDTVLAVQHEQGYAQENIFFYPSVFGDGFDLTYEYTPTALKETFIVKDKAHLDASGIDSDLTVTFLVETNGALSKEQKSISVLDENQEVVFRIKEANVVDSAENERSIPMVLYKKNGNLYIALTVPYSFFETATYPVFIDPTTTVSDTTDDYGRVEKNTDAGTYDYDDGYLTDIGVNTDGSYNENDRAWVLFDVDYLDDSIDVDSTNFYYYVENLEDRDCSGDPTLEFYQVNAENYDTTPNSESEEQDLWNGINDGTNYGNDDISGIEYWYSEDLGSTGVDELESLIDGSPTDDFMIGMTIASNEDSEGDDCYVDLDDYGGSIPYLLITYDPGCSSDSDCASGEYCETSSRQCTEIPSCTTYSGTYGSCSTEAAYTHSGNAVYYCQDYTSGSYDLNCYELASSLGDSDYCSYVVLSGETCAREEYSCSTASECSSGLICTEENVCCASDEIFDTATNTCEHEIACNDYASTNGVCSTEGTYTRSGDSVYSCNSYTSGSQEIQCYTEVASLGESGFCSSVVLAGEQCEYEETYCSSNAECSSGFCVDTTACCTDGDLWNGTNCEEILACGDIEGTNGECTTAGEYVVSEDYTVYECQSYIEGTQTLTCYFEVAALTDEDYCTYVEIAGEACILDEEYGTHSIGTYEYDANGNMIADGTYTYEYNDFNQLAAIYEGETIVEEYIYDHTGKRVAKNVYDTTGDSITTYYVGNQVMVDDGTEQAITTYVTLGNTIFAEVNDGETLYYHPDHLGSTSLITDETGAVVNSVEYAPFGSVLSGDTERYMYTGQELDDTGLQYYGARYYDPSTFHFIQPDPIIADVYNPQNLNRYSYVLNNPYRYVDPSGKNHELPSDGEYAAQGSTQTGFVGLINAMTSPFRDAHHLVDSHQDVLLGVAAEFAVGEALGKVVGSFKKFYGTNIGGKIVTRNGIQNSIKSFQETRWDHILEEKHAWSKVVDDPTDRTAISKIMEETILSGTSRNLEPNVYSSTMNIGDEIVEVRYYLDDEVIKVSDAWVQTIE